MEICSYSQDYITNTHKTWISLIAFNEQMLRHQGLLPSPSTTLLPQFLSPFSELNAPSPWVEEHPSARSMRQQCSPHASAWGGGKILLLITVAQLWQPGAPKWSPGKNQSSYRSFRRCSRGVLILLINASCCTVGTAEAIASITFRKLHQLFWWIAEFQRT